MRFRKFGLSLRMKLILSFAAIIIALFGMVLFNVQQVQSIKSQMSRQNEKTDLKTKALELKAVVQDIKDISLGLMISRNAEFVTKYNDKKPLFNQMIKDIGGTASTPEQMQWRSKLIMASTDYVNSFDQATAIIQDKSLSDLAVQKNTEYLYNQTQIQRDTIFSLIDNFYQAYSKEAQEAITASDQQLRQTVTIMLLVAGLVLVATVGIGFAIIRSFIVPVRTLQKAVSELAEGDLRHQISSASRDELGELSRDFDKMTAEIGRMLQHTRTIAASLSDHSQSFRLSSQETAAANASIMQAMGEISTGADQQAQQSERSSTIISSLEQEIQAILSYAEEMRETSKLAEINTEDGTKAVQELNTSASQTVLVYDKVSEAMNKLSARSAEIGKIVNTITEISAQTNVLSLNAAIEAARAGAHGKGFSVIAEEVRLLSLQTNESSKSIAIIISTLQNVIKELEHLMSDARSVTGMQNDKVVETLAAFAAIQLSMGEVFTQIELISEKINQARSSNEQLVQSVQLVSAVAQETAAGVEEVNSASSIQDGSIRRIASQADDIHRLSQSLFEEISRFQIAETQSTQETQELLSDPAPDTAEEINQEE